MYYDFPVFLFGLWMRPALSFLAGNDESIVFDKWILTHESYSKDSSQESKKYFNTAVQVLKILHNPSRMQKYMYIPDRCISSVRETTACILKHRHDALSLPLHLSNHISRVDKV